MLKYLSDDNDLDINILNEREIRDFKFSIFKMFLKLEKTENQQAFDLLI